MAIMKQQYSFDPIARYYDLDHGLIEEDIGLAQNFAQDTGGPILELGTGTGRLALPLARAGYQVVGVDSSSAMLAIAARRLQESGLQNKVDLVEADFSALDLGRRFPLVYCPFNTFLHLVDEADQLAALRCWRAHVTDDGLLIIDVENPSLTQFMAADGNLELSGSYEDDETGHTVHVLRAGDIDFAEQIYEVNVFYDEVDGEGIVRRTAARFPTRILFRRELGLLLQMSGFGHVRYYGDYDLATWHGGSPRLIAVARPMG